MTSVETSSRRARLMCLGEHRHWLNFFWNERLELCLSIKEGVKEFYVQVIDQPQEKTEKGQQEWQILAETRVEYKLQLASLLFREPFFFVQCLPWFFKQPARPIPRRCWKFFDFSPSKDSSICKWPNRWKRLLSSFVTLVTVSSHHELKRVGSWPNWVSWVSKCSQFRIWFHTTLANG